MAVLRMVQAGAVPITWIAVMSEWQRDWAREATVPLRARIRVIPRSFNLSLPQLAAAGVCVALLSGVASAQFQVKGPSDSSFSDLGAAVTSSPYQTSWDTTGVTDGGYQLRVVTADVAGNMTTSAARTVTVDNTAPTGSLTAPADGAAVRASVTVSSNSADAASGVASVQFQLKGPNDSSYSDLGTAVTSPPFQVTWDTTAGDEGSTQLRAVTTDVAGNTATSAAHTVTVDNTAPSATMNGLGFAVHGTVGLTSTTSDSGSGIDHLVYEFKESSASSWTVTPAAWDTTATGDGLYDVRVTAYDGAGNSTVSAPISVNVLNAPPAVTLTSPSGYVSASASDPFTVTATSPSDVDHVELFRCDNVSTDCAAGSWVSLGTDTSAPYTASWPVDSDGNRALRAVVTDVAGKTAQDVVNVTIDGPEPPPEAKASTACSTGTCSTCAPATSWRRRPWSAIW